LNAELQHAKLESALKECESHLGRLDRGYKLLEAFFPLTPYLLANLDDLRVEQLDQFLFRFAELQDAMGARLFPAVDALLSGKTESRPFIDILMSLEKYGVVENAGLWQEFRELRNNLSHEYPDNFEESVVTLNLLSLRWPQFRGIYIRIRDFVISRAFVPPSA
jgi:hypothetical protein